MAGRSVDVSLRIKAQDEASKALDAVGKALKDLGSAGNALSGGSSGVEKFVESLSKNVDGLSALFKKLDTTLAATGRAYENQSRQLAAVNSSIIDRKRRIEELTKAETDLQRIQGSYKNISPAKQATFVGPVPPKLTQVRSTLGSETGLLDKEQRSLDGLISKLAGLRAASEDVRGVQAQLAGTISASEAAFAEYSVTIDGMAASEKAAAAAHAAFEARVKSGADAMLAEAAAANKLRSEVDRANQELAQRRSADTLTPQTSGKSARDSAGVFEASFAAEEASLKDAAAAHAAFEARVKSGADALHREEAAAASLGAEIEEMRRDFDRAGYANAYLTRETEKLNRAVKLGILNQNEYGKALETVKRKSEQLGDKSNPALFGLNPYQTQNLMFQFNDIATQLASGASLTQTLSQQGGQILQLFPKVGNSIVGALRAGGPYAIALAATIGTVVLAMKSAADQAERLRSTGGLLAGIGTEGDVTAQQLSDVAKGLDRYGLSAEDALSITKKLTREGFDASQIRQFGEAAKNMSDVLGIDLNQAVGLLTDAYGGNIESLRRLMDETDAFTPAQRVMIEQLYSSGDAAGALDKAFAILSKNMDEGAKMARGPWAEAFRSLGNSWSDLTEQLGNTWWAQAALDGVNALAEALGYLSGKSESARRAEAERQGMTGGANPRAADPLAGYAAGSPGVVAAETSRPATAEQQANASKLTEEARRQVILAKEVTSQKDIQRRLDVIATQERERLGDSVTKEVQADLVASRVARERIDLEKQLAAYQKRQADEAERQLKLQASFQFQAKKLLRELEGTGGKFTPKAYWDVNAYRVGYGSDTTTRADGMVQRVNQNTTVTKDDAERDLARRIEEFANVVKQQIGSERFNQFSGPQQAALVSVAYNYGQLPKRIVEAVKTGTSAQIATAVRGLANDNNGINRKRRNREADILGTENLAVEQGAVQAASDAKAKLDKYNETLDDRLDKEERSIANQRELVGLQGAELRAAIERQQVAEAIAQATDDLQRSVGPDATLSQEQVDRITVDVKARLKLDEPQKVAADLQKQVDALQGSRSLLEADLQAKKNVGDAGGMRQVQDQIEEIDARIAQAAQTYLDFLNTPGNADALGLYGVELDNMIAKMTQLSEKTAEWQLNIGSATITASEFANAFTNTAVSALDGFAQAIASGKNAFSSLWDAFRQFAADFLLQIAKMIQQQIIFNLVSGLLKGLVGGLGGGASASTGSLGGGFSNFNLSSLQFHRGGVVGSGGEFRSISSAAFNGAARYHSGGIAGLKPNEVPAVLMRGEEVLTRDDPRHMLNGGGGAGGSVKIVNAFDVGDAVSKGMETKAGERAVLNLVRNNPRAFRAAMGNG